ncbi:7-carboxy-7-deazaguanine synthase QueE [Bacillus sp. AFS041924]|uniref:7-carboxy-7-deazaguanine synthase QueE n=1 Tax=Bacillus sp. AFS041924 TaxID=2033503 RepID=UPI000BFE2ECF|nr:7-carboxy-7-deazaguanine synthase QueE [Bacillus sp. AFS041924]PGS54473.1 7-carboxy-7-deazaguanine synthase QueE [Bacillus sp. AFS041924]
MSKIPVLELFGPTVQGEGMAIGQKTMFIRTAGCDYSCSWCDSSFTWDGSEKENINWMTAEEVWENLVNLGGDTFSHITISGGNPALLPSLGPVVEFLKEKNMTLALETQGSKWQSWLPSIDEVTLSPKPPSSGMNTDFDILGSIIQNLEHHPKFCLKVVIFDEKDLAYAETVHQKFPHVPFFLQVGNSWLNADDETLLQYMLKRYEWLIDEAMKSKIFKNVKVLPQLHAFVWGNKRGV